MKKSRRTGHASRSQPLLSIPVQRCNDAAGPGGSFRKFRSLVIDKRCLIRPHKPLHKCGDFPEHKRR